MTVALLEASRLKGRGRCSLPSCDSGPFHAAWIGGARCPAWRTAGSCGRARYCWLIYTAAGFLLAPYLIERYLPSAAQERLGQRASVGAVRINPFTLTFEASDFRLESGGEKPLLAFRRLFIDFELWNVFQAPRFADIELEGADLALEIDREGRLNTGRKVAAGKLSLVLEYKIIDSQLAGENRIALRDFVLG